MQTIEKLSPEDDSAVELQRAPWNTALHGVVSLYDVLKYAAADFYRLSDELRALAVNPRFALDPDRKDYIQGALNTLYEYCEKLDLPLSKNQIGEVVHAVNGMNLDRMNTAFHELQRRVQEELKAKICFCLPGHKVKYWSMFWLVDTPIYDHFR